MISEAEIRLVVTRFYQCVREDDLLGPVFAARIPAENWDNHENHIADFWSSIFLKTKRFKGNPMLKHLALPEITPLHFSRWLNLFSSTAIEALPAEKARPMIEMAERIGQSFQMGLAFHHDKSGSSDNPFKEFSALRRQFP